MASRVPKATTEKETVFPRSEKVSQGGGKRARTLDQRCLLAIPIPNTPFSTPTRHRWRLFCSLAAPVAEAKMVAAAKVVAATAKQASLST